MIIPNAERAVIDVAKLRGYALSSAHPEGRHKARVFLAALGVSAADAEWLASRILAELGVAEARIGDVDSFGQRFEADLTIVRESRSALVRTAWIIRNGEKFPRLTTCFVV